MANNNSNGDDFSDFFSSIFGARPRGGNGVQVSPFDEIFRQLEQSIFTGVPTPSIEGHSMEPDPDTSPRDRVLRKKKENQQQEAPSSREQHSAQPPSSGRVVVPQDLPLINPSQGRSIFGSLMSQLMFGMDQMEQAARDHSNSGGSWGHSMSTFSSTTTEYDKDGRPLYKTVTKKTVNGETTTTTSIRKADGTVIENHEERSLQQLDRGPAHDLFPRDHQFRIPPQLPTSPHNDRQQDTDPQVNNGPPVGLVRVPRPDDGASSTSTNSCTKLDDPNSPLSALSSFFSRFWNDPNTPRDKPKL